MTAAQGPQFGSVQFGRVREQAAGMTAASDLRFDGHGAGERAGLVIALAAHGALFALLSLAWGAQPPRAWPKPQPIEVSLVKDVALEATAPPAVAAPAPSVAPEVGAPDEAPPPPPAPAAKAEPSKPPAPKPEPAKPEPVKPAPAPAPVKAEPKAEPAAKPKVEPKPAPLPKAAPKVAPKPAPATKPAPAAKPAAKPTPPAKAASASPAKSAPAAKAATAKTAARPSRLAGLLPSIAAGAKADATAPRARGRRLGDDIVAGLSPDAPAKKPAAAGGAKPGPYPTASIVQAIARQIQPCADRQVNPGPGANRIVTTLNIRLNQDGTLATTPHMVRQSGVTDENERYAQRVTDLGVAAFKGCTPLKLPADYYSTPSGGWSVINYQWQLR